jgi:hypothetical protein
MGAYSAAGTVEGWVTSATKWVDLSPGLRYAICLANATDADITSGTLTVEAADADPEDICKPGEFSTLTIEPDCASPPGVPHEMDAVITLSEQHKIPAHSQCQVAFPCPKRFIRVTGAPANLDVTVVIRDLKRSGMSATDTGIWPGGFAEGGWPPTSQIPAGAQVQAGRVARTGTR